MRPVAVALAVLLAIALALGLAGAAAAGPVGDAPVANGPPLLSPENRTDGGPAVVAVVPDPVADGDRGEFVVVRFPRRTALDGWRLVDGETSVALGERAGTIRGRIALSPEPAAARTPDGATVVRAPLSLANGGERLRLVHGDRTVDVVRYADAPEGEVRTADGWRPVGATAFPVVRTDGGRARAFVLPDAPRAPVAPLWNASRRLLLAGYSLSDPRVRDALVAADRRGVRVRVLVEAAPVGGMSLRGARTLDALADAGVPVRVVGGSYARYEFHHAKYAVVDDQAVVLTENWKPAGTGGRSSRGWGVDLRDAAAADALARVFRADWRYRAARPWNEWRAGRRFDARPAPNGTYPSRIAPARVPVERAALLVAPDNAERAVLDRLDGAEGSIAAVQATVGRDSPFARALLRAARRGVRVRLLLSGAWYAREENRRTARWLEDRAPLTARVAESGERFGKIHAKGAIVDGRTVLLGSMNWNRHSARENREVVVALTGTAVADYYRRAFRADWRGGRDRLPVGVLAVLAVGALGALLVARRLVRNGGDGARARPDRPARRR